MKSLLFLVVSALQRKCSTIKQTVLLLLNVKATQTIYVHTKVSPMVQEVIIKLVVLNSIAIIVNHWLILLISLLTFARQ